ncbi:MAG TPA: hypothetical protein VFI00_08100 [Kribbella sp.]|nr:hypothetical protein [Kribbella sp.]
MSRTRWVLAALLAACLLGACSDDDPKPDIADPTPSANSSSPTADTSSALPSTTPQDAIQAWVAAENEALATGSTDDLRNLAAPGCNGCDGFPKPIEDVYAAGGSFAGGLWKLVNSHVETNFGSAAHLTAAVRIAGGTTTSAAGADPVRYGPQHHLMSFDLTMQEGGWRFSAISFVS